MSNAEIRGRFVWHELMTTDPQAAGVFYSKVLSWKTQPSGMPDYTLWVSGKTQAGGLMAQPESAGGVPSWLVYIGTPDVDATTAAAERLGGKVHKPPADIPGVGRFAVLSDPQGATFAIFKPSAVPAGAAPPADFAWHELATSDVQGALAFYSELFGWSRGPAHDMGPQGTYHIIEHGGAQVGGSYKLMDTSKAPHWLTYIHVGSVDKAAAAAKAAGGKVTQEPMAVPGGRIALILDPQGGAFAVHESATQAAAASAPATKTGASAERAPAKSRPAARKSPAKAPAKRAAAKKAPARPAKRAAAKAKKRAAASKRSAAGKSPAKKAAAKRAPARKAARKKSAKRPARKK